MVATEDVGKLAAVLLQEPGAAEQERERVPVVP